ncbi:MAG: PQQ-dependent sugar dehydrogenase, partial [Verrucomicrobiales bacterium]
MVASLLAALLLCWIQPIAAGAEAPLKLEIVAKGFRSPVFVTAPPGDTNRIFIVEQSSGHIRIVHLENNSTSAVPFLVVTGMTTGGERGLLGLAFHPNYAENGYLYVNYTGSGGATEIARYKASGDDPMAASTAIPSSRTLILRFAQPEANHNGGWIGFGKDGYLYIASGDGGGGNDEHGPIGNGQNRENLLGKILRIDVDNPEEGKNYGIPDGNPFKDHESYRE